MAKGLDCQSEFFTIQRVAFAPVVGDRQGVALLKDVGAWAEQSCCIVMVEHCQANAVGRMNHQCKRPVGRIREDDSLGGDVDDSVGKIDGGARTRKERCLGQPERETRNLEEPHIWETNNDPVRTLGSCKYSRKIVLRDVRIIKIKFRFADFRVFLKPPSNLEFSVLLSAFERVVSFR